MDRSEGSGKGLMVFVGGSKDCKGDTKVVSCSAVGKLPVRW
jgi:hypothetical protein